MHYTEDIHKVQIKNNSLNPIPKKAHITDACFDLQADFSKGVNKNMLIDAIYDNDVLILYPGGRCIVPTNIATSFDSNYMMKIMQRSGLAIKNGVVPFGGVIDSSFRNYWGVILFNLSSTPFVIHQGDKIAQAALIKIENFDWEQVNELSDSDRSINGFGSTGV